MSLVTIVRAPLLLLLALLTSAGSAHASIYQTGGSAAGAPLTAEERLRGYRDGRVLVRVQDRFEDFNERVRQRVASAEARAGIRDRHTYASLPGLALLQFDPGRPVKDVIRELQASGLYEYVVPDRLIYPYVTPNDPSFGNQWGLHNTGQASGQSDADIDAPEAWDRRRDASNVIVGVIDSGMNLMHEDLAANLWVNPNVGSGSVNRHGLNARTAGTAPDDESGHGTHVAGTIGAIGNNGRGVAGVAWGVKLMALRFLPDEGGGSTSDAVECINFAIANGAHILNGSYGSPDPNSAELDAIRRAGEAGIIFVAAAGNDGTDNDRGRDFPASYLLPNVVGVAASTRTETLASFSNYGSGSVELAAPGDTIYSTLHETNASYGYKNGTSMAAPHVTGALALLKAEFPNDTPRQLINRLLRSVDRSSAFIGRTQTGGRLNLQRALTSTNNRPFNDDFADRAILRGPNIRVRSDNTGATGETGESTHAGHATSTSLWWEWTTVTSGRIVIDTSGSSYDTLLSLNQGDTLTNAFQVRSNDDFGGATTSRIEMDVIEGITFQIAVAGKNNATGLTVLRIGSVPTNDNFAAAAGLIEESFRLEGSTRNATRESNEPTIAGTSSTRSVWYRWVAPFSGRYQLAAFSTEVDTVAGVYTGDALNSLTQVAANDDISSLNTDALVTFTATSGTTYYFAVGDLDGSEGGAFTLTLNRSLWQFPATDEITGSPAVGPDGTIYFGAFDGYLYAVTPGGSQRWRYSVGEDITIDTAAPAVASDGTLYIGTTDGVLHAVGSNGQRRWRFPADGTLSGAIVGTAAIANDGTVYFRTGERLYALTPAGAQKWTVALSGSTYSSPVIATDGTIYVGAAEGELKAINPNGTTKWTYSANSDIYSSPAIAADGTIYFATLLSSRLYALRPDGTLKWSITAAGGRDVSSSPVLGPDGTIYYAGYDARLWAISNTGSVKWSYTMGDEVRASSPAIDADGTIYIGSYDGHVHAVSSAGQKLRTYPTARNIRSTMTLADGRLYFGSQDAKLYAFEAAAPAASPWPQFQHDPAKTGRASSVTNPNEEPPPPSGSNDDPRLPNLSTRARVGSGEEVMIGGLYVGGGTRQVLVRAIGPDLANRGVSNALPQPILRLYRSGASEPFATNEGWGGETALATAADRSGASPLPAGSEDAALLVTLTTGAYTATVSGEGGSSGEALVEFFEVGPDGNGRFRNLSTRASVSDQRPAIAGFNVSSGKRRVLIRVAGPALAAPQFGITSPAADPKFVVIDSTNNTLAENNDWSAAQTPASTMEAVGAFPFTAGSKDAAVIVELDPGNYTVVATNGVAASGIVLMEIYLLD